MTVIVIILLLASLIMPTVSAFRRKAQRAQCVNNLKNLQVAAASYINQNSSWPQIDPKGVKTGEHAKGWIAALRPFGISEKNWICPAAQELLGNPDYMKEKNTRIDYMPMPFDSHYYTPYKWGNQPWFVEKGDMHGDGNLIIFPDGRVEGLRSLRGVQNPN